MTRNVILDVIHVELRIPHTLAGRELAAARRALASVGWMPRLRRAVRAALRADPALKPVRVRLGR